MAVNVLILSSHLHLGLPSGSFPQVSSPKPCIHLSSPPYMLHAPIHLILLNLITQTILGEQYRSLSSSLCKSSSLPCYLVPLKPNNLLSTLFSNTLSLCYSLNVSDQVSHPYRTIGKVKFCIS